ncbi:hypothetical protein CEXT_392281 [Caerostris extrusa]|uniref:Uncharacterized protein n=1 Tax=Caerostris extrusa TaxID=172846 RepID=A0AAV4XDY3_CAEEX|nr:hypothetical protein CEXT_392281 [Caerostris extrusa]
MSCLLEFVYLHGHKGLKASSVYERMSEIAASPLAFLCPTPSPTPRVSLCLQTQSDVVTGSDSSPFFPVRCPEHTPPPPQQNRVSLWTKRIAEGLVGMSQLLSGLADSVMEIS